MPNVHLDDVGVSGSIGIAAAASGDGSMPAAAETGTEVQEPAVAGSVQAPGGDESLTEVEEAAQLEGLATITEDEADEVEGADEDAQHESEDEGESDSD